MQQINLKDSIYLDDSKYILDLKTDVLSQVFRDILRDESLCSYLAELGFNTEFFLMGDLEENIDTFTQFVKEKTNQEFDFVAENYNIPLLKTYLWSLICPPYNI